MRAFRRGEIDVLVATTVIEVGVDVPNATVMVVEDADRFGLSQLHQLRGRVGRGGDKSYCFLFADPSTEDGEQRLEAMAASTDGFALAEKDLEIRGSGEVFGEPAVGVQRPEARPHPARRGDRDAGPRRWPSRSSTAIPSSTRHAQLPRRGPATSWATTSTSSSSREGSDPQVVSRPRGLRVIAGDGAGPPVGRARGRSGPARPRTSPARRCSPRSTPGARSTVRTCSISTREPGRSRSRRCRAARRGRCWSSGTGPRSRHPGQHRGPLRRRTEFTSSPAKSVGSSPAGRPPKPPSTSFSSTRRTRRPTRRSPRCWRPCWRPGWLAPERDRQRRAAAPPPRRGARRASRTVGSEPSAIPF